MFRYIYVILINFWRYPFVFPTLHRMIKNKEKYPLEKRYKYVLRLMNIVRYSLHVKVHAYGVENIPSDGSYVMYPNHQGKFDLLAIFLNHKRPCSFVVEKEAGQMPLVTEIVDLLNAKRLDNTYPRQAVKTMNEVTEDLKDGMPFVIFPEGYYDNNENQLNEMKPGAFKCAVRAKVPIVPVALIDTYKAMRGTFPLRAVHTKVVFLPPISYEDYKDRNTVEIRDMVQSRVENCIEEYLHA